MKNKLLKMKRCLILILICLLFINNCLSVSASTIPNKEAFYLNLNNDKYSPLYGFNVETSGITLHDGVIYIPHYAQDNVSYFSKWIQMIQCFSVSLSTEWGNAPFPYENNEIGAFVQDLKSLGWYELTNALDNIPKNIVTATNDTYSYDTVKNIENYIKDSLINSNAIILDHTTGIYKIKQFTKMDSHINDTIYQNSQPIVVDDKIIDNWYAGVKDTSHILSSTLPNPTWLTYEAFGCTFVEIPIVPILKTKNESVVTSINANELTEGTILAPGALIYNTYNCNNDTVDGVILYTIDENDNLIYMFSSPFGINTNDSLTSTDMAYLDDNSYTSDFHSNIAYKEISTENNLSITKIPEEYFTENVVVTSILSANEFIDKHSNDSTLPTGITVGKQILGDTIKYNNFSIVSNLNTINFVELKTTTTNTHTVTFTDKNGNLLKDINGNEILPQEVYHGSLIQIPTTPYQNENTLFSDWYFDFTHPTYTEWIEEEGYPSPENMNKLNPWYFSFFPVLDDITLIAKFDEKRTITLNTCGGNEFTPLIFPNGYVLHDNEETNILIPKPAKENATFFGWYFDAEYTQPLEYPYTISKDITLYAKWTHYYEVTFDTNNLITIDPIHIKEGNTISEPTVMSVKHYTFKDWYTDTTYSEKFNFTKPILENTTVYGLFEGNLQIVNFNSNGGTFIINQSVPYNELIKQPSNPTKKGYIFKGWYTDKSCVQNQWDFNKNKCTEDMTLYAKWEPIKSLKILPVRPVIAKKPLPSLLKHTKLNAIKTFKSEVIATNGNILTKPSSSTRITTKYTINGYGTTGKTYTLTCILRDIKTGEIYIDNKGKKIEQSIDFIKKDNKTILTIPFIFDSRNLSFGDTLVAYVYLRDSDGHVLYSITDNNNSKQSIYIKNWAHIPTGIY